MLFNVTTDGSGLAAFSATVLNLGASITATAAAPDGNTSEFSAALAVTSAPTGATITATDATAAELGDDTATFVISRPVGEPTTAAHPVSVSITGGAQQFTDYAISGPGLINFSGSFGVDIPAGQTSVTVTVTPEFRAGVGRRGNGGVHGRGKFGDGDDC